MSDVEILAQYRHAWDEPEITLLASFQPSPSPGTAKGLRCNNNHNDQPNANVRKDRQPGDKVEDRLNALSRAYEAKMLQQRLAKETIEANEATHSPALNRNSVRIASQRLSGTTAVSRLSVPPPPKEDPPVDAEERNVIPARPTINVKSANLPQRGVEAQRQWLQDKERKIELKRQQSDAQIRSAVTASPSINSKSRAMVEHRNIFEDPMALMLPVEERLLRRKGDHEMKRALEALGKEVHDTGSPRRQHGATPAVAAQRLFDEAEERRRQADEMKRQQEILSCIDDKGTVLFRPAISTKAAVLRREDRINGVDVFSQLATPKPKRSDDDQRPAATPRIGAYSTLLANLNRTEESTFDRLATPRRAPGPPAGPTTRAFSPTINKHSAEIDSMRHGNANRIEMLMQKKTLYEAHRERLQREKENVQEEEVTRLMEMRNAKANSSRAQTPDATYKRMNAWANRTESRLRAQREQKELLELEGCTFKPKIAKVVLQSSS